MQRDIPSNSQIFGQIVRSAKIEGILYPSKMSNGKQKLCIAIFPENFDDSNSFVEIEDDVPESVTNKRLDQYSYRNFY